MTSFVKYVGDKLWGWLKTETDLRKIALVLGFLLAGAVGYFIHDYKVRELEQVDMNIVLMQDEKVTAMLEEFMYSVGADRAYIFQFHNGINYYSGEHMHRMSNTHEATRRGVSAEISNLTNLQVKDFRWFLQETVDGKLYVVDVDRIPDAATRYILQAQGIKSLAVAPMFVKGAFVGYVGVDYVFEKQDSFNEGYIYRLEQFAQRIAEEL